MGLTVVHELPSIMQEILRSYALPVTGYHGVVHWARVLENGLRVAEVTGGDREVVALFALFHDSRRINEYHDDGHGMRGASLARSLRGSLVHLDDERFELLHEACSLHTDGLTVDDPTLRRAGMLTGWTSAESGLLRNRIGCVQMQPEIYCAGHTIVRQKVTFQSMC